MYKQLDISTAIADGERLKEDGMQRAIDHADAVSEISPQWSQRAFNAAVQYVREFPSGHQFKTEDVRLWADKHNKIEQPPSDRAWGGVIVKLANQKLIYKVGHAVVNNPNAHRCFATLWAIQ
jgi:hypothetical protein